METNARASAFVGRWFAAFELRRSLTPFFDAL